MIDENHHLDHKYPGDDGKQIEVLRFYGDDHGYGHQRKPQKD